MSPLRNGKWSRREVLKQSGILSALGAASASPLAASAAGLADQPRPKHTLVKDGDIRDNLFTRIGVRPMINGRGTFTIISGSCSLPEVKQAMYDASFYFVQLDEMMNGIGAQLAELTGAEWGITTTGCAAAICLATVACIAGADVELCQALPYKKKKDQVIIPRHSRNPYDIGVRMCGVEIVEVDSPEEFRAKLSDRTAMVYILSGPDSTSGPMSISVLCAIANEKNVPVFVDAAAEEPNKPNIHLAAGASLVGYSGGKCMRGPQSSGMMIGKKDLCKAAYYQAAPHHCYGRALKCSKEEAMGLLAAVRQWYKRDHAAEQAQWTSWMQHIAGRLKGIPSLTTEIIPAPVDLSNRCPSLRIHWDAEKVGITGTELAALLDAGTPRIVLVGPQGRRPEMMQSSIGVMSYMMEAGEEKIIADALYAALTKPGSHPNPVLPTGAPASIQGSWAVTIQYIRGTGEQKFVLEQKGNDITGEHHGEIYNAKFQGVVHGDQIELHSVMPVEGNPFPCNFKGTVQGNSMSGTVTMGEYGEAKWSAVRA
ncbi:PLP-dependent transferase [Edaphobacter modestus]|uniref:Seryl-tRNA(Sec) selenium transferase n=1 Tax=Edaphobacter modestus TaxID=388466 RepID=A0A4Q7YQI5_9BACT|nr:PLP-dependent transferase [Edaphobacter modestus]RZU39015.1 seryl-tRNA(Sec) selenium transferase [Edaphobacter modestus]